MKTRIDIIKKYGKGKSVVELGVYAGTFSKQIWHEAKPSELWLVDPWVGSGHCGNDNGTHTDYCVDLEDYYLEVKKYFADNLDVRVRRERSYEFLLNTIPSFGWLGWDLIYIDADHDPRAILVDLAMSRTAIKNGGYVSGHDYKDGVKSVVDWFCQTMGYKVFQTTDDKIPSFYFQVTK